MGFQRFHFRLKLRQPRELHIQVVAIRAYAFVELVDEHPKSPIGPALARERVVCQWHEGRFGHREIHSFLWGRLSVITLNRIGTRRGEDYRIVLAELAVPN
jgi:hypothetical protein